MTGPAEEADDTPVVVRFAALGDAVLLTALLDGLAQRYGRPVDVLTSGAWAETILGSQPFVRQVRTVSSRKRPYLLTPSQWQAVAWLRRRRGAVWLCDPEPAARRLVERAVPLNRLRALWDRWPGEDVHWADWWYAAGRDLPIEPGAGRPVWHCPRAWQDDAREWLLARRVPVATQLVLLQPGSKRTSRRFSLRRQDNDKFWPVERWARVAVEVLAEDPSCFVVLCGTPREADITADITRSAAAAGVDRARLIDAATELPLARLAGLASFASAMISVDTGPAHLAAALDCPVIVLFGRHGYRRWVPRAPAAEVIPLGSGEWRSDGHVAQITVAEVVEAWCRLRKRAREASLARA